MPQLHHRDPSIIGLLGASPHLSTPVAGAQALSRTASLKKRASLKGTSASHAGSTSPQATSEAFDDLETPPQTPLLKATTSALHLVKGKVTDMAFERPFYELIVDGIHSHPNSVRVRAAAVLCPSLPCLMTLAPV